MTEGAPTTEGPPMAAAAETVLVCPRCGATSPADARLCRRCFTSLAGAASVAAGPPSGRRRLSLSWPSTLRGWVGLAFAVVVLLVAAWWVRGWLEGPPPPHPTVAGDRTVAGAGEGWSTAGGDLGGTRRTEVEATLNTGSGWRRALSSAPSTSLVSDGTSLYAGLEEGVLVALDAEDGGERWRSAVPGELESAPAIAGDRLYVGYRSGSVAAIDVADGATIWETQLGVSISTTPVVVDGIVFVAGNGILGGFDAEDGTPIWRREISDSLVPASPVVDEEVLVVASFDRVLIFDRANGELLSWAKLAPQHAPIASIAIDDDVIFVTADQQLLAISTSMRRPWWDGVRPVWEFFHVVGAAPDPPWRPDVWNSPIAPGSLPAAIDEERVFVASADGVLAAYARLDGALVWRAELTSTTAPPVVTSSGLLVAGEVGVWLVDPADGTVVDQSPLRDIPLDIIAVESGSFVATAARIEAISTPMRDRR